MPRPHPIGLRAFPSVSRSLNHRQRLSGPVRRPERGLGDGGAVGAAAARKLPFYDRDLPARSFRSAAAGAEVKGGVGGAGLCWPRHRWLDHEGRLNTPYCARPPRHAYLRHIILSVKSRGPGIPEAVPL